MDKLRKLFRRKNRNEAAVPDTSSPIDTPKRPRTPGDPLNNVYMDVEGASTRKRARSRHSSMMLYDQATRADSHTGSRGSTTTTPPARDPPKLDWAPTPAGGTGFTSLFDDIAIDSSGKASADATPPTAPVPAPIPAPKQTLHAKRSSLPPAAIFARGVKRFTEEPPREEVMPEKKSVELPQSAASDFMADSKYFSNLSDPTDTSFMTRAEPGKPDDAPASTSAPEMESKPKRHPLIP